MFVAALSDATTLAIAAGVISLVTLVVSTIQGARTLTRAADAQRVANLERDLGRAHATLTELEKRVEECERGRADLKREVTRLENREVELLRRLVNLEGRG